jgi:two-component system response regulator FixJ
MNSTPNEPTVFIVDDDPGVLDSIKLLARSVGLDAETFSSAADFLEAYDSARPGCLVLDVRMPGMSGLELQERLESVGSTLPIIFVTAHGDVPMAVQAVKAGAMEFVQKPFRDQELIDKIQLALEENSRLRAQAAERTRIAAKIESLTPRERQVMHLVAAGKPNKAIARELALSQRTVEIHRARVMEKMQAANIADLCHRASACFGLKREPSAGAR